MATEAVEWNPSSRVARRHERRVFLASQPLGWCAARYARMLRREVVAVPGLGYVVSGAVAVREVLLDAEHFPNSNSDPSSVLVTQALGPNTLANMNGPAHMALRRKLHGLFTPKFVDEFATRVLTEIMEDFHDRLAAGETVDVARFARIMTGAVACHLNGLELHGPELQARALELTDIARRIASMVPARLKAVTQEKLDIAHGLIEQLLFGAEEAFRSGDATSTIPGRLRDSGLTWEEARGIITILILGGTETTQSGTSRLVALMHDTNQWGRLRADHSLLENTLDEGLRFTTPVPAVTRWVGDDYTFRGKRMRRDRLVITFGNNAVRDRRVISDGNDFDIGRAIPRELRQIWFGAGPHFCVGFNLARQEIRMVLQQLLRLPREVEVVDREYGREVLLPTYTRLEIRQRPA